MGWDRMGDHGWDIVASALLGKPFSVIRGTLRFSSLGLEPLLLTLLGLLVFAVECETAADPCQAKKKVMVVVVVVRQNKKKIGSLFLRHITAASFPKRSSQLRLWEHATLRLHSLSHPSKVTRISTHHF